MRQGIFLNDDDRRLFLTGLAEAGDRFALNVFAYVLMGKHYHLSDRWDVRARQISGEHQSRDLQNQASERQGTAAQIQPVKLHKRDVTPRSSSQHMVPKGRLKLPRGSSHYQPTVITTITDLNSIHLNFTLCKHFRLFSPCIRRREEPSCNSVFLR